MDRTTTDWNISLNARAALLAFVLLAVLLGLWEGLDRSPLLGGTEELSEYELLLGGADETARVPRRRRFSSGPGSSFPTLSMMQAPTTRGSASNWVTPFTACSAAISWPPWWRSPSAF